METWSPRSQLRERNAQVSALGALLKAKDEEINAGKTDLKKVKRKLGSFEEKEKKRKAVEKQSKRKTNASAINVRNMAILSPTTLFQRKAKEKLSLCAESSW